MFLAVSLLNFQVKRPKTPVNKFGWAQVALQCGSGAPPIVAILNGPKSWLTGGRTREPNFQTKPHIKTLFEVHFSSTYLSKKPWFHAVFRGWKPTFPSDVPCTQHLEDGFATDNDLVAWPHRILGLWNIWCFSQIWWDMEVEKKNEDVTANKEVLETNKS